MSTMAQSLGINHSDHYRDERAAESGGIAMADPELAERQKQLIARMMRRLGASFFEGKPLTKISLHVSVFEPRSFLERLVHDWDYASFYLPRAAMSTDPVERVKLVAAFVVAGLHRAATLAKPFNPLLGETYQAQWQDGTRIFLEQSSHHPPVSHWIARHPKNLYTFMGFGMFNGKVVMLENCVKTRRNGLNIVEFADTSRIVVQLPYMVLRGLTFGERKIEYLGAFSVTYEQYGLVADFTLDPDPKFLGIFGSGSAPSDSIRGVVYEVQPTEDTLCARFSGLMNPAAHEGNKSPYIVEDLLGELSMETRLDEEIAESAGTSANTFKQVTNFNWHPKQKGRNRRLLCHATGTYLGYLDFDGERYWDMRDVKADPAMPVDEKDWLPTDSQCREDIRELGKVLSSDVTDPKELEEMFEHAQEVKEEMEEVQRADRKRREAHGQVEKKRFFPLELDRSF